MSQKRIDHRAAASVMDQMAQVRNSLNEIHRTETLDLPTISTPTPIQPVKDLTVPEDKDLPLLHAVEDLEPAQVGDARFAAKDMKGNIAVFKDRRTTPRRAPAPLDQSNPTKEKEKPPSEERFPICLPLAGGGTLDISVSRIQREQFIQKALDAQDLEAKKKSSEIWSNRANSGFAWVGAVLALLGIIAGIRAETRSSHEQPR